MCEIFVTPIDPSVDDVINITITGLNRRQNVTIKASTSESGSHFTSFGCYVANEDGVVDVSRQQSSSGTYTGKEPMGLFWSMKQAPEQERGTRYMKRIITSPQVVRISVLNDHLHWYEIHSTFATILASKVLHRFFCKDGVKRVEVKHGRLRGTLFIPGGKGPFPAVLDMFGSAGGILEFRAAMMANRGILSYALPYVFLDESVQFEISYFKEAAQFLDSHPLVLKGGIGVCGVSKGGEIALRLATVCSLVKAVVNINGPPFISMRQMTPFKDFVEPDYDCMIKLNEGNHKIYLSKDLLSKNLTTDKLTQIWKTEAKLLYLVGELDASVHPEVASELYNAYPDNKRHNIQIVRYAGAGHLIEPPFLPVCHESYLRLDKVVSPEKAESREKDNQTLLLIWGGESASQARASENSWKLILEFFHSHLIPRDHSISGTPSKL